MFLLLLWVVCLFCLCFLYYSNLVKLLLEVVTKLTNEKYSSQEEIIFKTNI